MGVSLLHIKLVYFSEEVLRLLQGREHLFAVLAVSEHHWVFNQQAIQVAAFVNLADKFGLGDAATLVY
jgi:hypothetical protein